MSSTVASTGRQIGIIVSASFSGFMVLLDSNIVNISLPIIAPYFNISMASVVQITLVYLLILSSTLIIFGKLADKYGIKRIFILGFCLFTLSSLFCGISTSFNVLLLGRILQAMGGSMLYATSISLITKFIPVEKRGWAFGIFAPISTLGILVGNPLGGLITGYLNWHWIFLVNLPVGIFAIIVAMTAIPGDFVSAKIKGKRGTFDFLGSFLSFIGLSILVFFISKGRDYGWTSWIVLTGFSAALLFLVGFVFWEKRVKDPILDLTIFSSRSFSFAILASLAGFGLMMGSSVLLPFYLTYEMHIDVKHAGFILMTYAVLFTVTSPITGRLSDRVSKVRLTISGMLLAMMSSFLFAWTLPLLHLGILFAYMVFLGISLALFITPNNNLVMSLADVNKQSISSSVFKLATNLGQMFGLIIMQMLFSLGIDQKSPGIGQKLSMVGEKAMMTGFSWAYIGGGLICLLAIFFSLFIKEKDIKSIPSEETAYLG